VQQQEPADRESKDEFSEVVAHAQKLARRKGLTHRNLVKIDPEKTALKPRRIEVKAG
jgi:hypothetical protein